MDGREEPIKRGKHVARGVGYGRAPITQHCSYRGMVGFDGSPSLGFRIAFPPSTHQAAIGNKVDKTRKISMWEAKEQADHKAREIEELTVKQKAVYEAEELGPKGQLL